MKVQRQEIVSYREFNGKQMPVRGWVDSTEPEMMQDLRAAYKDPESAISFCKEANGVIRGKVNSWKIS